MSRLVPAGADARRQLVSVEWKDENHVVYTYECGHNETWPAEPAPPAEGTLITCKVCLDSLVERLRKGKGR